MAAQKLSQRLTRDLDWQVTVASLPPLSYSGQCRMVTFLNMLLLCLGPIKTPVDGAQEYTRLDKWSNLI